MNIFVGNLPKEITEEEFRQAFAAFGEVKSVAIIKDKQTREPRGFGFIDMPNDEEAKKAIDNWNGNKLKGKTLTVNPARPQSERRPSGDRRFGGNRDFRRPRNSNPSEDK
ncbi:MAG: RNA-binding protein [Candidatus Coatesbacteria bacterium]|nr:RNA-binding protein [Candidatus Coatesbacteria bacterium]